VVVFAPPHGGISRQRSGWVRSPRRCPPGRTERSVPTGGSHRDPWHIGFTGLWFCAAADAFARHVHIRVTLRIHPRFQRPARAVRQIEFVRIGELDGVSPAERAWLPANRGPGGDRVSRLRHGRDGRRQRQKGRDRGPGPPFRRTRVSAIVRHVPSPPGKDLPVESIEARSRVPYSGRRAAWRRVGTIADGGGVQSSMPPVPVGVRRTFAFAAARPVRSRIARWKQVGTRQCMVVLVAGCSLSKISIAVVIIIRWYV